MATSGHEVLRLSALPCLSEALTAALLAGWLLERGFGFFAVCFVSFEKPFFFAWIISWFSRCMILFARCPTLSWFVSLWEETCKGLTHYRLGDERHNDNFGHPNFLKNRNKKLWSTTTMMRTCKQTTYQRKVHSRTSFEDQNIFEIKRSSKRQEGSAQRQDFPPFWSAMLGFSVAAISPAVVVPSLLALQDSRGQMAGRGSTKTLVYWKKTGKKNGFLSRTTDSDCVDDFSQVLSWQLEYDEIPEFFLDGWALYVCLLGDLLNK